MESSTPEEMQKCEDLRTQIRKEACEVSVEELKKFIKSFKVCPNCNNCGAYAEMDFDGDPCPVQCDFCWTNPKSLFNMPNAILSKFEVKHKENNQ